MLLAHQDCLRFHLAKQVGNLSFGRLVGHYGSASKALGQSLDDWQQLGVSADKFKRCQQVNLAACCQPIQQWLETASDHHLVSYDSELYPHCFRALADPPPILYIKGNPQALSEPCIAIVGSRNASPLGLKTAQRFGCELSQQGLAIVSGLAIGIDGAAHQGCLSVEGRAIAFLGTGVDRIYPKSHLSLAEKITEQGGALVSEFPLKTQPHAKNFPPRNRLISMLAMATLVIECAPRSGSMITAHSALEQGKEVFAVPGPIIGNQYLGCHQLIQQGAYLVTCVEDIIDQLPNHQGLLSSPDKSASIEARDKPKPALSAKQQQVLTAMGYHLNSFEELQQQLAMPHHRLQMILLELELIQIVQSLTGNRWQRLS